MSPVSPQQFLSIVSLYCTTFQVSPNTITLPNFRNGSVPYLKLRSTLDFIQLQWLEQVTGRPWSGQQFAQLNIWVIEWIASAAETCPSDSKAVLWYLQMWKRGAETFLKLNTRESA